MPSQFLYSLLMGVDEGEGLELKIGMFEPDEGTLYWERRGNWPVEDDGVHHSRLSFKVALSSLNSKTFNKRKVVGERLL